MLVSTAMSTLARETLSFIYSTDGVLWRHFHSSERIILFFYRYTRTSNRLRSSIEPWNWFIENGYGSVLYACVRLWFRFKKKILLFAFPDRQVNKRHYRKIKIKPDNKKNYICTLMNQYLLLLVYLVWDSNGYSRLMKGKFKWHKMPLHMFFIIFSSSISFFQKINKREWLWLLLSHHEMYICRWYPERQMTYGAVLSERFIFQM